VCYILVVERFHNLKLIKRTSNITRHKSMGSTVGIKRFVSLFGILKSACFERPSNRFMILDINLSGQISSVNLKRDEFWSVLRQNNISEQLCPGQGHAYLQFDFKQIRYPILVEAFVFNQISRSVRGSFVSSRVLKSLIEDEMKFHGIPNSTYLKFLRSNSVEQLVIACLHRLKIELVFTDIDRTRLSKLNWYNLKVITPNELVKPRSTAP